MRCEASYRAALFKRSGDKPTTVLNGVSTVVKSLPKVVIPE